jgi:hypothetical protein
MLWGGVGLVALSLYLLNMDTLFAISFLTPLVLFFYVLGKVYNEPEMADKKKALRETFLTRHQARTRQERYILQHDQRMKDIPSFRMTYGAFKELFPNGYVFYNPVPPLKQDPTKHYWNNMTRLIMFHAIDSQHKDPDAPVFPTLDLQDSRLPWKEKIYGMRKNGDAVAYTRQFLKDNPLLRTTIGGEDIVIVYHEDVHNVKRYDEDEMHGIVTPFYADGYTGESVDVYGNTDDARKFRRFEGMLSQLFWMIWVNFEKDTAVNRI